MASIIFDKKTDRFAVQFKAVDKRRRTIRLGKETRKAAEVFRNHVENLIAAQTPGQALAPRPSHGSSRFWMTTTTSSSASAL
jgi:hypothetical protein